MDFEHLRKLLHAFREPLGAFAINVALFADERLSAAGQKRLDALRENIKRMEAALGQLDALGTVSPTEAIAGDVRTNRRSNRVER